MLFNYLKIAFRSLLRNKVFSLINVFGLAIGIACCIFILFFVQHETSYDSYNYRANDIYRLKIDAVFSGNKMKSFALGAPVAKDVKDFFTEVEKTTRLSNNGTYFVEFNKRSFKEKNILFTDSSFFDIFTIDLLSGSKKDALNKPYNIIISKAMAEKYFGKTNPIGQTLLLDNVDNYKVTAVFDKIPVNSHFKADFLAVQKPKTDDDAGGHLGNMNYFTYILFKPNTSILSIEQRLPSFVKKYIAPDIQRFLGKSFEEFLQAGNNMGYILFPLQKTHLYAEQDANSGSDIGINSSIEYVYIFSAIGFFILVIACINFMNLSTARSAKRSREVGIRKVVGSDRKSLISQFLCESIFLSFISLIIALIFVESLLPFLNSSFDLQIETSYLNNPIILLLITGILLFTGVAAGFYPAFMLSSFQPALTLKGSNSVAGAKSWLRRGLVVFQFSASIILIIVTIVIYNQLNFIHNKKLGFNKEQVVYVEDAYILGKNLNAFKEEMKRFPGVISASVSGYLPIESQRSLTGVFSDGNVSSGNIRPIQFWRVDFEYLKTFGIEMKEGRNFSEEFKADSSAILINEAAQKFYNFDEPNKHTLGRFTSNNPVKTTNYKIIGVVKDFHYQTLRNTIEPLVLSLGKNTDKISFRINPARVEDIVREIKTLWGKHAAGQPLNFQFLDEGFSKMYAAEQKTGAIFSSFALLAIFIACLGLFGLSAFTAEKRTKEIGIRKVLGGSVSGIVVLLSKEFALLVAVSFLFSVPAGYYIISEWLAGFAYKIEISVWYFIMAGALTLLIALSTVGYHAIKASLLNPVNTLKYE